MLRKGSVFLWTHFDKLLKRNTKTFKDLAHAKLVSKVDPSRNDFSGEMNRAQHRRLRTGVFVRISSVSFVQLRSKEKDALKHLELSSNWYS